MRFFNFIRSRLALRCPASTSNAWMIRPMPRPSSDSVAWLPGGRYRETCEARSSGSSWPTVRVEPLRRQPPAKTFALGQRQLFASYLSGCNRPVSAVGRRPRSDIRTAASFKQGTFERDMTLVRGARTVEQSVEAFEPLHAVRHKFHSTLAGTPRRCAEGARCAARCGISRMQPPITATKIPDA